MKPILLSALVAFALTTSIPCRAEDLTNGVPATGRTLFLRNCAHCHGADAHGDEGPDLHALDWTDTQITTRIRKGKSGQMTAFEGKLTPDAINQIVAYVRTLK